MDSFQVRLNRMLNSKNFLNGIIAYQRIDSTTPNQSGFGFIDHSLQSGQRETGSWRHVFTRQVTGLFTAEFTRFARTLTPNFANVENISGEAGITGNDQTPLNWGPPSLNFSGGSGIAGVSDQQDSLVRNQTLSLTPQLLWFHRPHNVTVQMDFRRQQFNTLGQSNARGSFGFTGAGTGLVQNGALVPGTGYDFADFLLGKMCIRDSFRSQFQEKDMWFSSNDLHVAPLLEVILSQANAQGVYLSLIHICWYRCCRYRQTRHGDDRDDDGRRRSLAPGPGRSGVGRSARRC